MLSVHIANGILVLAANLFAGLWGSIAWLRQVPAVGFWYALRVAQVVVVVQVALGSILLLAGHEAPGGLHYLYGVLPLVVSLAAEAIRSRSLRARAEGLDFDSLPASADGRSRSRSSVARPGSWPSRRWWCSRWRSARWGPAVS